MPDQTTFVVRITVWPIIYRTGLDKIKSRNMSQEELYAACIRFALYSNTFNDYLDIFYPTRLQPQSETPDNVVEDPYRWARDG